MTGTDPYVPGHGDAAYAVDHYALDLAYRAATNRLEGEAVLTCRVLEPTSRLRVDLRGLTVTKVALEGAPLARYTQKNGHLTVTLRDRAERGDALTLKVKYAGRPDPVRAPHLGEAGWEELTDGVIVASQPHGAPSWFPCNDRPDDKATYAVRFTTAAEYVVGFSGETLSVQRRGASRTWEFRQTLPMATYLASVQVGHYVETVLLPQDDSAVPMRVLHPAGLDDRAFEASFGRQREMLTFFERVFGPYPFAGYTAVVTDDPLEIPLEAQALSTFGRNHCSADWESVRLVAHELSHQWFGNAVTARSWRDIWLHEGFACYAEWLWSEESGGPSAAAHAAYHHSRLALGAQRVPLADPTPAHMFDDWVYKRGALTLHALRSAVGDEAFFSILRSWVATHTGGSVATEQFIAHAETVSGRPVAALLEPWLYRAALP